MKQEDDFGEHTNMLFELMLFPHDLSPVAECKVKTYRHEGQLLHQYNCSTSAIAQGIPRSFCQHVVNMSYISMLFQHNNLGYSPPTDPNTPELRA